MPRVVTASATLDYADVGAGRPIVLLHATLHDRRDFDDVVTELAATHRVLALDWPGHGASPLPDDGRPPGAGLFADVLEEFVDALDLDDVVLIGNSVGGHAACRLAAARPGRVAGVITVNGAGFTPDNAAVRTYCRALGHPGVMRRLLPTLARAYMRPRSAHDRVIVDRVSARARTTAGAQVAAAMWRSFATPEIDLRPHVQQITCPVLIVWGRKDLSIPRFWATRAHRAIAGSQFALMDTGHVAFSSDPPGFLALALPFMAEIT